MSQPLCYLLSIIIYDIFLLNADEIYLIDLLAPALAFIFFQKSKIRTCLWLLGLNLFIVFIVASYLLNGDFAAAKIVFVRTNLILLLVLSLLLGRDGYFLLKALFSLRMPQKLIAIMMIYSKLFEELLNQAKKIPNTLKARGVRHEISLFNYEAYANIIGKIIINGFDRSFGIFKAMKARGYSGRIGFLEAKRANLGEILFFALVVLTALVRGYKNFI
ncbi:CbiQ family ECF transporter T component [Campylobacter sp.]|uniref:CbiQ family ECF transporter T component n=1 Tax=Campylobacter sp. TaxID=205 RepID=UPI0026F69907|nr:CbiQ family ECF transporter T component [Campylobacter sp.]